MSACLLFVLETIRTSAMRVIHIIVKTEETQKLRIVFVLCCATWIQTQTKSTSTNLALGRHLNLGLKTWGLLCRMSPTFVLQSPTQGSSTQHLSVHGFCAYWTTSPLEVCLAVANPYQRRSKREVRQRISPCMDFAHWTTLKVRLSTMSVGSFELVRFSLYFGPRENSPWIHLQATLLSPHICTVGPSLRWYPRVPNLWGFYPCSSSQVLYYCSFCVLWKVSFC